MHLCIPDCGTDESVPCMAQCQIRVIPSGTKWSRGIFAFGFCFADLRCEDPSARLRLGRDDVGDGKRIATPVCALVRNDRVSVSVSTKKGRERNRAPRPVAVNYVLMLRQRTIHLSYSNGFTQTVPCLPFNLHEYGQSF